MAGSYIYSKVGDLEGKPKVSTHSCATLVQWYTRVGRTSGWVEGIKVKGNTIKKGTAVATFVDGKYPNKSSGNHVAFYISQSVTGIKVMDQWS